MLVVFEKEQPSLEVAQSIVDGPVTMVRSPDHPDWQVLVNEEGLLHDLPFNEQATEICGTGIVGNAIILKGQARWD